MNDFKSEYQSAVQDMDMLGMKEIHIDALSVMDESRHRKCVMKRLQRVTATTFSAVCVIFLCGFGTVKAAEYIGNVIKVNEWGFESGDAATMARSEAEGSRIHIVEDEVSLVNGGASGSGEDAWTAVPAGMADGQAAGMQQTPGAASAGMDGTAADGSEMEAYDEGEPASGQAGTGQPVEENSAAGKLAAQDLAEGQPAESGSVACQSEEGYPAAAQPVAEEARKMQGSGTAYAEESAGVYADSEKGKSMDVRGMSGADPVPDKSEAEEDVLTAGGSDMIEEIPVKNYDSWEEFEKNEDIVFAQPSVSIGGRITSTDVTVCGDWVMVRYDVDGKVLWMERTDYAGTQGHASSKVFPGGVCNERSYTTPQGYTYTLIDSVKAAEDTVLQIHAAVTVGSYEAFIDFLGYTEEEAELIMDSIDLSVYE